MRLFVITRSKLYNNLFVGAVECSNIHRSSRFPEVNKNRSRLTSWRQKLFVSENR